jgi:hypothetical protein
MSDKDLLARLRAKAETAQQSPELPSTEQAAGGSDLLERLKAKSAATTLESADTTVSPAPIDPQPTQPIQADWQATPEASIDIAAKPIGVSAGVVFRAQTLAQKAPVVSEQKAVKAPFRESPLKLKARTPLEVQNETTWATSAISNDFDSGIDALPAQYKQNATTIAYTDPNNPIHKITDPHGDPAYTGTYLQSRMNSLAADINKANAEGDLQTRDQYQAKLKDLRKAGAVVVDLQLFNKEYSQKKYTPELAATAISSADERYKAQKAALDAKLAEIDKWEHPDGVPAEKARRRIQYADMPALEKSYQDEIRNVKAQTKYNPVLLGAEKEALLGNKDAQKDYEMLLSGKAIDPARNYAYQDIGRRVIQLGIDNTQNENAKKEAAKHADVEGKSLISENLSVLTDRARQVIANKKYNDENSWATAIIPSSFLRNISKEEIKKYAEEEGFGAEVTNELLKDPAAIPKTVSLAQQTAKGALNFLAPSLYSSGVRALGSIYDVPGEKMDEFFQPGWQEQRGVAAKIAGNMPSEQNSFRNIQGALGTMAETIGMMVPFGGVAKSITQGLEAGVGIEEAAGERLANGGIMAFEGYNNAYNESKDIVGDKPEDEGMRQAYSILSGLANGAIFSVHPPTKLVKAATGEMVKTAESLVNEMRKVGLKGVISSEFAPSYAKYIKEIAKAQGIIVAQADANHMAQNGLKNMFSKDGNKTSLTEGLGEETLRTYVSFFLPTLAGGIGAARSESPLNRGAAFEVASNPQMWKDYAEYSLKDGYYTESEYRNAIKGIDLLSSSLENTPVVNSYGEQMTPDQIKEYTFNLAMDGSLRDKLTSLKKGAELTKREVDKAQTAPIEKRISDLEKRRSEILDTKLKEIVPQQEVAAEEGSKENLVKSEEKDISLQLQESSQQKPQQNGNEQSNQGLESNTGQSKSSGSGQEADIRQTGNDQGRSEQEADRPIVAEPKDQENETAVEQGETRPAQRVRGKRRTEFKEEEPEEAAIEVQPLGEGRDISHTEGVFRDKDGKLYKSSESKAGPTQEHEVLKDMQDFYSVVRVGDEKSQTTKGSAFEIEELTPLSENEKITMEEARIIMATMREMDDRGIYAGEFELGRDSNGKLKIFDLSTAERRKDTKSDPSYSTFENNIGRIKERLSKEDANIISEERKADLNASDDELLMEAYPELAMAYDDSGSDMDKVKRVEAAWKGRDPESITGSDMYGVGYGFEYGKLLNPELLAERRNKLKEFLKNKIKEDASKRQQITPEAADIEDKIKSGVAKKVSGEGGRNLGVYKIGNKIVKIVKKNRAISSEHVALINERLGDLDNVYAPKESHKLSDGTYAIVMEEAPGKSGELLTDKEIEQIPQGHWDAFEKTIRELSKRGAQTDLTKRSNVFYSPEKGFSFIDIEGVSLDGTPTEKFIEKDGEQYYYPFERYPVFPKKYTSSKEIFTNIKSGEDASIRSKEQQQESAKQGGKPEPKGTEQARSETTPTEAESGNRNKRSEEEEKVSTEEEFDWEGLFNIAASEENKPSKSDLDLETRREEYKNSKFSKKWAATYDEAVTKLKADYRSAIATYFDYLRREYKKAGPDAKVFVGDEVGGRDMGIDSINEKRRQRNIKGAEMVMKDTIEDLKSLGLTSEEISEFITAEREKFEPSKKEEKVTPVRAEPTSFDEMLAEPEPVAPQQNAAPKGPKEIKDVTPHVTRSKTTDYIHLQEGMEVGDKVTFKQGSKTKYGTITGEVVKRSKNKALIGAHKIKAENTKKTFDFKSYNAAKKEIFSKIGEPENLEEAVLLHLLGGGTFRMGKDGKGIERHLGTRRNSEENKAARSAWLTEYNDRTKKDVADADQFGYEFNPENEQNEGEIGEILTQYKNKAEIVDRLLEIANEKEENRRKVEEYTPSVIEIPVTDHENGTVSYVYLDVTDPHFDEKYSAIIGIPDSEMPVAFSEEGHPIYEEGLMHQEAIDNATLTDAESDIINQIFGDNTDNLGEVDIENAHHELIKNIDRFTPDTQELIRKISPFPFGDENVEPAKKIISKIQKYESKKRSAAETARAAKLAEPSAEAEPGEGVPESRVPEQPGKAYEEPETVDEADNRLVEIADEEKELRLQLQKERAAQKIASDKMNKAEKQGNIDEANKQKDNYYKKDAKINKINDRLVELAKEERNIELDRRLLKYKSGADKLRKWGENITKGSDGMIGSFPVINPKNVKAFIDAVAEIYSHIGNLDVAISKAIDRFVFNGLEKSLSSKDVRAIRPAVDWMEEVPESRAKLSKANEDIAYDYVEDILDKDVDFTIDDAAEEINNLDISDMLKAKINQFVRWEVQDRERFNSETLREEKHEKDFLEKYDLTKSDKVTKYLSGETLEDVFGKEVQFDVESKEALLMGNIVQDAANMMGLAKSHYGTDDVAVFGADLLGKITKMPEGTEGKSVKKILAAAALHNELHAERTRIEEKLLTATEGEAAVLKTRLRKVNQIIGKAEVEYRNLVSSASEQLNAARAMRIIRNTFFKELFADRILNDAERARKEKMSDSLEETDIRDKVAEEGSFRSETEAAEEVAAAEDAMAEYEAKQAELFPDDPAAKKKAKSVIERFKDKVSGKKNKSDGRKEILKKEDAEKKAAKYLRGSSIEELIEKAKEQTKKPC